MSNDNLINDKDGDKAEATGLEPNVASELSKDEAQLSPVVLIEAAEPSGVDPSGAELSGVEPVENPTPPPAEAPAPPAEPKKAKKRWLRAIMLALLVFILPLVLASAYAAYDVWFFLSNGAEKEGRELTIVVEPGTSFEKVSAELYKLKAISSPLRFKLLAQYQNKSAALKAGEFAINTAWTPEQLLNHLISGKGILYRLAIREGLAYWEVAALIEEAGFAKAADFIAVIKDPKFLAEYNIPFANAEGFLFPDTYLLKKPRKLERAEAVAALLVKTFWLKNGPLFIKKFVAPTLENQANAELAAAKVSEVESPKVQTPNLQELEAKIAEANLEETKLDNTQKLEAQALGIASQNASSSANNSSSMLVKLAQQDSPQDEAVKAQKSSNSTVSASPSVLFAQKTGQQNASQNNAFNNSVINSDLGIKNQAWQNSKDFKELQVFYAAISPENLKTVIILASLVEKETAVPAERPLVAGVYANRLQKNMLLQCDPTIIYGIGPSFKGSITRSQLNDAKNIYNTYKNLGLPPSPICSSSVAAVKAALYPDEHNYLYFVATGKPDGSHSFSTNLQDHNRAVSVYRQSRP